MIICPLQTFGIGDCIWSQELINKIADGNKIVWGVESHFVDGLNDAYPNTIFVDKRLLHIDYGMQKEVVMNNAKIIPIYCAHELLQLPDRDYMKAKYQLYDMDWRIWREGASWTRNDQKEDELYKVVGLLEGDDYILVNRWFGSIDGYMIPIPVFGAIEMHTMPGFSLFHWAKIIENARIIHTVSTSIIYLLEMLPLKAQEIHLYIRQPFESDFSHIDYILERHRDKYVFHF